MSRLDSPHGVKNTEPGMKTRRRSNFEIMADILRLGRTGKSDIILGCDINYDQLNSYLEFLLVRGFLEPGNEPERCNYKPTVRGKELLTSIDKVRTLLQIPDRDEWQVSF